MLLIILYKQTIYQKELFTLLNHNSVPISLAEIENIYLNLQGVEAYEEDQITYGR